MALTILNFSAGYNETSSSVPSNTTTSSRYALGVVYQTELRIWIGLALPVLYVGAVGNILTMAVIVRSRWWKSGIQVLIASLTVADLIGTLFVHPHQVLNFVLAPVYPWNSLTYCRTTGYILMITYYLQPLHCCMIAINRFITIVLPRKFHILSSLKAGILMTVYCWILPVILFALPLAEVDGRFTHGSPFGQCSWAGYLGSRELSFIISASTVYVPTVVIFCCYLGIFVHLKLADSRLRQVGIEGNAQRSVRNSERKERSLQVAKMMGMTYVVFLACWVPLTSFFYLVRDIRRAPYPMVLLGMMLIFWLSDCCNTVIYSVMNKDFRDAYKQLFRRIRTCCFSSGSAGEEEANPAGAGASVVRHHGLRMPTVSGHTLSRD